MSTTAPTERSLSSAFTADMGIIPTESSSLAQNLVQVFHLVEIAFLLQQLEP